MQSRLTKHSRPGFALVVTITMMVLLTLLAIGLLSLSTVALRGSNANSAKTEARANARMALLIAIGDLQTSLGPDRRVSAPASLVLDNPSSPNLIGAWESWHWDPESASSPNYSEKKDGFDRWLVSSPDPDNATQQTFPESNPEDPVWLVKSDTNSPTGPGLRASIIKIEENSKLTGGMAYGVMDESLKAPLNLPELEPETTEQELASRVAPSRAYPEALVSSLDPETTGDPTRLISLPTAAVAAGSQAADEIFKSQHELTSHSVSLLTNVVDGGFKKDLTTGLESQVDLGSVIGTTGGQTLYFSNKDGAPTWSYLRDHYQHYRDVKGVASGNPRIELTRQDRRGATRGTQPNPPSERLLPVIAKLQIVFSIVSHYSHIQDRVRFFNTQANPKGNTRYACPHLVYDPVITLYNPYDVAIKLGNLRVRIWDPPVVFGFKKRNQWLRPEHATGELHGLARFQVQNQTNPNARKYFTLLLSEMGSSQPGSPITLDPGEVKVFSPWVEEEWNWDLESRGGYNARVFFDWDAGRNFGNRDNRTGNALGVESVPGWDPRAGLQTDHLTYHTTRPNSTKYEHEKRYPLYGNQGWLAILMRDTFSVVARPGRTTRDSRLPDFAVDLLAGLTENTERDYLRSYSFRFGDLENELTDGEGDTEIERTFRIGDLLQAPNDPTPGGKTPFSILTMTAKTTADPKDVAMPWLHNHPVTEGALQDSSLVGNALDTYDLRFEEIQDFNTFPGVELDPTNNRGFYGASATANSGVSNVPMFRVPLIPATSLGDLIPANLVASSQLPRVTHPLGNSRAHPLIPANSVKRDSHESGKLMLDHSYLINETLWDETFFSTAASFQSELVSESRKGLLEGFFKGERNLLNPRLIPMSSTSSSPEALASELDGLSDRELMTTIGSTMAIRGGFNINSDSVDTWRAVLSSLRDDAVRGWNMQEHGSGGKTAYPRYGMPLGGDAESAGGAALDVQGQVRWAGFRSLDDDQIQSLAEAIVEQLRERGNTDRAPNLSLGEFVNRRIGQADQLHVLAGLLERAIEESGINDDFHQIDSREITGNEQLPPNSLTGLGEPEARRNMTGLGAPSIVTQGDLLMPLASILTVRGDTFRIRAYGESLNSDGTVAARAWCEAVVQRIPEYVDPSDRPEIVEANLNEVNKRFGRRLIITGFRWLSPDEI